MYEHRAVLLAILAVWVVGINHAAHIGSHFACRLGLRLRLVKFP